ncbi:hypothetical protein PRZ48_009164 [Zasmidium cellare]|uniref:Trichothecene 3-O-acetyltransferase-like N-terminal domain-containing protein n=1 Tax=Zasmidium cellare TaxID=395010 RepID=A0ABR0EAZ2_ZASCE|nr:hypothetical protein PRZ48_009164 [Zasmidium cellare]
MGSIAEPEDDTSSDVMGQWPQLKSYNHGILIFRDPGYPREMMKTVVQFGAEAIVEQIPWIAEQVVHNGVTKTNSGRYETAPWPEDQPPNELVRFKDCDDLLPSFDELQEAGFPIRMLPADILCPVPGYPETYDESTLYPAPALIVQVNFIRDGVLVTLCNQHNVMDGTGVFTLVQMLGSIVSGQEIPDEDLEQANRDRSTVVPLYPAGCKIRNHDLLLRQPPAPVMIPPPPEPAKWLALRFSKEAAAQVKETASQLEGFDPAVSHISTNDAVSALFWKCIAKARVDHGLDASLTSKFSRAIDCRAAVNVPATYLGQMVYFAAAWMTLRDLIDQPLSTITSCLRKSLNKANTEYSVRSFATFLSQVPDKNTLAYGGSFNRETDISSSSMAGSNFKVDMGHFGRAEAIRRPNLSPLPSSFYTFPPGESGDLNLQVCLYDWEMEALKNDPMWGPHMVVIG